MGDGLYLSGLGLVYVFKCSLMVVLCMQYHKNSMVHMEWNSSRELKLPMNHGLYFSNLGLVFSVNGSLTYFHYLCISCNSIIVGLCIQYHIKQYVYIEWNASRELALPMDQGLYFPNLGLVFSVKCSIIHPHYICISCNSIMDLLYLQYHFKQYILYKIERFS